MSDEVTSGRKRRFRIAVALIAGVAGFLLLSLASLFLFACLYSFFPADRTELRSPGGNHSVFVESAGFVDPAYLVQARDWPWTFIRPYCVGDLAYWEGTEVHYSSAHWTRDGSAIVVMEHRGLNEPWPSDSYDFREHRRWPAGTDWAQRISERGGLTEDIGFHEFKGEEGTQERSCPWWVKALPLLTLAGGTVLLVRFVKKRVSIAQKYPL